MSPELIGAIGVIVLIILIMFRMWIGVALGVVGFIGIILLRGFDQALMVVGSSPFANINSYNITVIPMFTLMGMIIAESRIGKNLFSAANAWIGHLRGGLASASIVACGMLGAITGSHYVSTVIMGNIALPEMRRYKYDDRLATASIAAGAPLSIIIPPSMPFIMYGIITEQPIGKLFISGIIPGILMIIAFIAVVSIMCKRNPEMGPRGSRLPLKERVRALGGVIPMLLLFGLVIGGIYGGFFTTTESGAVGALGAMIIALVSRDLTWEKIKKALIDTALTTCMVLIILVGTYIFIYFISLSKLPFYITNFVVGMDASYYTICLVLALMYIILGMIIPEIPMIVLTVPILYPALMAIGFDPIWLGLFMVLMMALGAITPPIGMVVFIMAGVSKVPVNKIFRAVMPFVIADFIIILLVVLFPVIATWLPSLM